MDPKGKLVPMKPWYSLGFGKRLRHANKHASAISSFGLFADLCVTKRHQARGHVSNQLR